MPGAAPAIYGRRKVGSMGLVRAALRAGFRTALAAITLLLAASRVQAQSQSDVVYLFYRPRINQGAIQRYNRRVKTNKIIADISTEVVLHQILPLYFEDASACRIHEPEIAAWPFDGPRIVPVAEGANPQYR